MSIWTSSTFFPEISSTFSRDLDEELEKLSS